MRSIVALFLVLALAGCSSPAKTAPTDASADEAGRQSATPDELASKLPPIYINGTLTSAGGCPVEGYDQLPGQLPGDTQVVPEEAWSRGYDHPRLDPVPGALGAVCVLWLDAAGDVLHHSTGIDDGTVPAGATQVLVRGNLEVEVGYTIKVQ